MDFLESLIGFVTPAVVWGAYLLIVAVFILVSTALGYHWKNYNVRSVKGSKMMKMYIVISAILLVVMFISAAAYSL